MENVLSVERGAQGKHTVLNSKKASAVMQAAARMIEKKLEKCSTDKAIMYAYGVRKMIIVKIEDFESHETEDRMKIFIQAIQTRLLVVRKGNDGRYFYLTVDDVPSPIGIYDSLLEYLRDVCKVEFTILFDTWCSKL